MFIIKRDQSDGGGYVNQPGSKKSYTNWALHARKFETLEEAQANCFENEFPVNLDYLIKR